MKAIVCPHPCGILTGVYCMQKSLGQRNEQAWPHFDCGWVNYWQPHITLAHRVNDQIG